MGGRSGGLSLFWALKGADVVCSDVNENGFSKARQLHKKYGLENQIRYEVIDALKIPYKETFDVICFKSVLGGVGYDNNYGRQEAMMENIYSALKADGYLFFAENLAASPFHKFLRKHLVPWGGRWRYITIAESQALTKDFSDVDFKTYGFLGTLGRKKTFNNLLSSVDKKLDRFIKDENKYIISCVCRK